MGNYHSLLAKSPAFFAEQAGYERPNMPPQHVLDAAAERTITGGYQITDDNLCPVCFTYRSATSTCFC